MTSKDKKEQVASSVQEETLQENDSNSSTRRKRAKIQLVKDLESFADSIDQQIEYFLKM